MAWDIYGQPLTPGTCEVHIGVPEPYPCVHCREDYDREERRHDYYDDRQPCEGCYYATGETKDCDGSCNTAPGPDGVPF